MFSLIGVWINGCVNNRAAGDLRRHRAHYNVNVMFCTESVITSWGIFYFVYWYNADMVNWQLYNLVFHSKWAWRITCNKYEDTFLSYVPVWIIPSWGYLQIRIKWSPSCAVVFIIDSSSLHHPWLGSPVIFIIRKFQWPLSWKQLNECTRGFSREPLVSQTICMQSCKLLWMKYTKLTLKYIKFCAFRRTPRRMKSTALVFISLPGVIYYMR